MNVYKTVILPPVKVSLETQYSTAREEQWLGLREWWGECLDLTDIKQ